MPRLLFPVLLLLLACTPHPDQPLMRAAETGDLAQLRLLLARGVDIHSTDRDGLDALDWAARGGQPAAVVLLTGSGAEANSRDLRNGWTPLLHAIHKHQEKAVEALLISGANPDMASAAELTPLIMAAGYGDSATVKALLRWGADPGKSGPGGTTPLSAAVSGTSDIDDFTLGTCQTETVRALLSTGQGADLGSETARASALRLARLGRCREVLALLKMK